MSRRIEYPFRPLPNEVSDTVRDCRALQVYVEAMRWSDPDTGHLKYPPRQMAERLGVSLKTVQRGLAILKKLGFMDLVGDPGVQHWIIIPPSNVTLRRRTPVSRAPSTKMSHGSDRKKLIRDGGATDLADPLATDSSLVDAVNTQPHASESVVQLSSVRSTHDHDLLAKREIQDQSKQTRDQGLRAAGEIQDRETDPRSLDKPRQVAFGLEVQEPDTLDPERLLAGDYDARPDDPRVLRAAIALWSTAWSTRPGAVIITKPRQKAWTEAMRAGCTPSHYARAILGMRWETTAPVQPGDFNRFKCCDFEYITRRPDVYAAVFDERGDPRQTPGFVPGRTFLGSPAPGGGRGGDRAHGGSGEAVSTEDVMRRLAAEKREREAEERARLEREPSPEELEAERVGIERMRKLADSGKPVRVRERVR